MNEQPDQGHPIGPEIDDSQNPTHTAPDDWSGAGQAHEEDENPPRQGAGREMLSQLQSMIDTLAVQAGPVMREVAAKAAELAAVAGEKAGPLAQKAAEKTGAVGQRVAARSKEMAADLRRPQAAAEEQAMAAEKEPDDSAAE